jgi:hypothetical protein
MGGTMFDSEELLERIELSRLCELALGAKVLTVSQNPVIATGADEMLAIAVEALGYLDPENFELYERFISH